MPDADLRSWYCGLTHGHKDMSSVELLVCLFDKINILGFVVCAR